MRVLAIDPATKVGWAHSSGISGTWDCSIRRDESSGMRLIRFQGKLNEIYRDVGIELLAYEAARNAGRHGNIVVQAEMQGIIKHWCEERGIPYTGLSPTELKKHATGRGNCSKEDMIAAAALKWGRVMDDNEADALFLLDLVTERVG